MQNNSKIFELIDEYQSVYVDELKRVEPIITFLNKFEGEALFDRKNFVGHITASAYIINSTKDSLLLLKHKTLNRWLQPGGHVDATDSSLMNAALREAKEETGIAPEDLHAVSDSIFDIDSHPIPENAKKMEDAHVHHDISFLFICKEARTISIDENESTSGKWVSFVELDNNESFKHIIERIREITS